MTSKAIVEAEALRMAKLYEALRERLLDLSLRNRMLNYRMSEKSKSQLRIVYPESLRIRKIACHEPILGFFSVHDSRQVFVS